MRTPEQEKKLAELKAKRTELEKSLETEQNGQKIGGIKRGLNNVMKKIEELESQNSSDSGTDPNGQAADAGDASSDPGQGNTSDPDVQENNSPTDEDTQTGNSNGEDLIKVLVKSTTGGRYRRIGRAFTRTQRPESVTAKELELLKADPWLEVVEED